MEKTKKRIALIVNEVSTNPQEGKPLEDVLRDSGNLVDIFDVNSLSETNINEIKFNEYGLVVRLVKSGARGDSEKSWDLQRRFEQEEVESYISVEDAISVTDKIKCKERLTGNGVSTFLSVTVDPKEDKDRREIENSVTALGKPPYAVRMSIGSGKKALVRANNLDEVHKALDNFKELKPPRGTIIHKLTPLMDETIAEKYGLKDLTELEKRHYHFRIIVIDGKIFSANIFYTNPGEFGLNRVQGGNFQEIDDKIISQNIKEIARLSAMSLNLKLAAIDIALDENLEPHVLDMNASPDFSRDEELKKGIARSIGQAAMQSRLIENKPQIFLTTQNHGRVL